MFLIPRLIARGVLAAPRDESGEAPGDDLASVRRELASLARTWLGRIGRAVPLVVAAVVPALFLLNGASPEMRPPFIRALLGTDVHTPGWLFEQAGVRPVAVYFSLMLHGAGLAVLMAWAITHLRSARLLGRLLARDSVMRVRLRILHPDKCMGLQPISDMVRQSAIVLLLISLTLFLWSAGFLLGGPAEAILANSGFRVTWTCYLVFAPLLFIAPLASARRRMWDIKEETLARLARQIQERDGLETSKELSELYQGAQQASVWPFTWATLSSFVASLGIPLLITVATQIVGRLVRGG
jgi:hypothetical protein